MQSYQQSQPTHIMGDIIEQLPADNSVPSYNETIIVDKLFQKKKNIIDKILLSTKDILIMGILFIMFSLPQVDELIKRLVKPAENSPYILVGIKAVLFMVLFFIIKNVYLARKSTAN